MRQTFLGPIVRLVARSFLLSTAVLCLAGCRSTVGGGDDAGGGGDAVAGEATYAQVCAQCHGTPGANAGEAPDLEGTGPAAIETEVTGDSHGGGTIEGFLDKHYQEMAAYLAQPAGDDGADGDDDAGGGGGDDDAGGGDDDAGGGDAGDGDDTDVATACSYATAADIASVRQSVQTDYLNGISAEDELSMMSQGCLWNPNVPYDDCVACATAIVNEIYP